MAFITKKHLSRRTFLNGVGVTIALPFLESMVPAGTPLAQTAATGRTRFGAIYFPHGATMDKWTPAADGTNFDLTEILQPLDAVPRPDEHHQRPEPSAGLRRRLGDVEPQPVGRDVPERRPRGSRAPGASRHHDGSGRRAEDRPGHAAAVARADDRGRDAQLRRRPQLRVSRHDLLAEPDLAAADGEQPAGRVRATVRRRQHRRRAPRRGAQQSRQPARFGRRRSLGAADESCRRATAPASTSISATSARSSAGFRRPSQQASTDLSLPDAPDRRAEGCRCSTSS